MEKPEVKKEPTIDKPTIFIDGDFNDSYEARVKRATGKKKKVK